MQYNFCRQKLAVKVIMDCRTIAVHKFRTPLGLIKKQSVLTRIISSFEGENM